MSELENKLNNIAIEKEQKIIPENIKKGVSIFGVVGNMSSGTDTSDATATANDIKAGTTAYTATGKAEGTLTFDKFTPDYPNCLDKVKQIKGVTPLENPYFIGTLTNENINYDTWQQRHSNIKSWITEIPLLDTSNVTNMALMFQGCVNLKTIPLLNTSSVTNMEEMFRNCTNLISIPKLDTLNVANMNNMFQSCANLTSIPELNTSNTMYMSYMFSGCTSLTSIPQLDTLNVTGMSSMFEGCSNLATIPELNTSNAMYMSGLFQGCTNLKTIPLLDTSKADSMYSMFMGCTNLTTIPKLDTLNVTDVGYMFGGCTSLIEVPLLNTTKVTRMSYMFENCPNLSDESLNNILQMCINSKTTNKTLRELRLSQEQATKCATLSNWQAFLDAGWTSGY